jgi:hypothetical protein
MESLLLALNIFIATYTNYPIVKDYPEVIILTQQEMQWKFYGCKGEDRYLDRKCRGNYTTFKAIGLYDSKNKVIYLSKEFKENNPKRVTNSVLLHELVHYLQDLAGVLEDSSICRGLKEVKAYRLQQKYLEEAGMNFYKSINVNELFIRSMLAECHMS